MKMKLKKKHKWSITIIFLAALLLLSMAVFGTIGTANIGVGKTIRIVLKEVPILSNLVDVSDVKDAHRAIIINIRIPRVILGALVGAALATVGAAFQGVFKNPMADPYVIGISSGAALGASIVIISGLSISLLGISSVSIGAFFGALLSTLLVYLISRVKKKVPVTTLLLSGIAVGQFFTAVMSFLMVIYSKDVTKIIFWTLGSFSAKGWDQLLPIALPTIISIVIINFFSRDLNVMLTGEESAKNMGIEVEKVKVIILLVCAFTTAMAVSVSGIIGFIGLIIPHIVRLLVGPDHRILIPSSALAGGTFMIFADTIARIIISPTEIPVGIITALFGGPFFIYLLRKKKRAL